MTEASSAALAVNTSNHVYIRSEEYAWVPGRLLETNGSTATVSVPQYKDEQAIQSDGGRSAKKFDKVQINLEEYHNKALLLQNVDEEGRLKEVEDMVELPFLHEVSDSSVAFKCFSHDLRSRHMERVLSHANCSFDNIGCHSLQFKATPSAWQALYTNG